MRPATLLLGALAACDRAPPTGDSGVDSGEEPGGAAVVRVVTWNVESLGTPGSEQYEAVRDVLARIGADVVALNEIDAFEEDEVATLGDELGYDTVVVPNTNPFGSLHNAVLTRLPLLQKHVWTSVDLSDDPDANDLTRWPVGVEVETAGGPLAVVGQHWKSGFYTGDEFRRVVDSLRSAQAARDTSTSAVVLCGDVNAELTDPPPSIPTWSYVPADAPSDFVLGDDLRDRLDGPGIPNDVFGAVYDAGLEVVDAVQRDGRPGTRDSSGRRLDHLFVDPSIRVVGAEVYDARDEGQPGLDLVGSEPDRNSTTTASDHFPVFADLEISN